MYIGEIMEILFFSLQVQVRIKTTETNHIFAGQTVSVRNHIWITKIKIQNKISPFFVQKKNVLHKQFTEKIRKDFGV